jgi:hypothetical protein
MAPGASNNKFGSLTVTSMFRLLELLSLRIHHLAGTGCSGGPDSPSDRLPNTGANMFRLLATVAVVLSCVLSAVTCPPAGEVLPADDKKASQEAELKQLAGRWTRFWEEKLHQDKISRRRMDLEFVDGRLNMFIYDERGVKVQEDSAKVIGVEKIGTTSRLRLEQGEIYCSDFVTGGELVVIGWPNPWAFPPISGEYKRAEKMK